MEKTLQKINVFKSRIFICFFINMKHDVLADTEHEKDFGMLATTAEEENVHCFPSACNHS